MKQLWAPWRLEYIQSNQKDPKKKGPTPCPFCEVSNDEPNEENLCLYRDDEIFVVMNKFPYNPGHLLVLPRGHFGRVEEIPLNVWNRLGLAVRVAIDLLGKSYSPQGFNVGLNLGSAAGAGIPDHLHWHILPRWAGDTNFMPLIAETKALPTHNRTVYQQLAPLFTDFARLLEA